MVRRPSLRLATLAVVAACSLLVAMLANMPRPSASGTGSAPDRASQGGGAPVGQSPFHPVVLTQENKPKPQVLTHPTQLALHGAHSKVFNVKSLKSDVVKLERPENDTPGLHDPAAPVGDDFDAVANNGTGSDPETSVSGVSGQPANSQAESAPAPSPSTSFDGLDFASWGAGHPPDPNGDVGPAYYIQTINTSIGIYDKSNGNRVAAFTFNALMSQGNFGNLCDTNNFGDPVVLYDTYEDRWFLTDFAFKLDGSGNVNPQTVFQCFAVSKTGDPVAGGWNFYSIQDPGGLGDYPKFGVLSDGIYMSANMFGYAAGSSFFGFHV